MNYITTNHRGGLGNAMFKIAAVISLSIDNAIDYKLSKEFVRPGIDPDYSNYTTNVFRHINFVDTLPTNYATWTEPSFNFTEIPYEVGTDLLLDGYYQSYRYFENNKSKIVELFKPTEDIKQHIIDQLPDINTYNSLHIRRGDYLKYPNHHPQQSTEYYKQAVNKLGLDKTYLVFSDDLNGCVDLVDFIPNKLYIDTNADWLDMYIMSLCQDNIICNSSFSWWGAYLNTNPNKAVITPINWFGPAYDSLDTSDICPLDWTKL